MDAKKLAKHFPELVIRNRTPHQQHVQYMDDSLTIQPNKERRIPSAGLMQVPDNTLFELVRPTVFELEKKGIVVLKKPDEESPQSNEEGKQPPAPSPITEVAEDPVAVVESPTTEAAEGQQTALAATGSQLSTDRPTVTQSSKRLGR